MIATAGDVADELFIQVYEPPVPPTPTPTVTEHAPIATPIADARTATPTRDGATPTPTRDADAERDASPRPRR